jgi:hypothetical protein
MSNVEADAHFDPSLHLIPLDKEGHVPVKWLREDRGDYNLGGVLAVTSNGRLSTFPSLWKTVSVGGRHKGYINELELETDASIRIQFPDQKDFSGNHIKQYILACVMYGSPNSPQGKFISKVYGLTDSSKELDSLYKTMQSLSGKTVGSPAWRSVESSLSSEPMRSWLNGLISNLKAQGWIDYVKKRLDE